MKKLLVLFLVVLFIVPMISCASVGSGDESFDSSSDVTPSDSVSSDDGNASESESETTIEDLLAQYDVVSPVTSLTKIGAPALGANAGHGGNQTRIAKTSHGIYVTYLSGDEVTVGNVDYKHYSLVRVDIESGAASEIYDGLFYCNSNSPYVLVDDEENVWVVCGGTTPTIDNHSVISYIWKYDHKTGEITEYTETYRCGAPSGGYGYAMGFIDNYTDQIYLVHCGGDKLGMFAIMRFDIKTCTYVGTYEFRLSEGRHAYAFGFSDGKGGFSIVAQRDITIGATGSKKYFQNNNYWAGYVWDDLRLFTFTIDENNDVVRTGTYEVDYADYVKESLLFPQNIHYRSGDTFIDSEGNMHVFYRSSYDEGIAQIVERHVILNSNYEMIYKGQIDLDSRYLSSEIKMYQTTEGVYYLVVMPKRLALPEGEIPSGNPEDVGQSISEVSDAVIQIYRSEDGIDYSKVYEEVLEGERWTVYHISATQPRNGSLIDNKMSLMMCAGNQWHYAVVDFDALETLLDKGLAVPAE